MPKEISLKNDFPNGGRSFLDGAVRVLRGGGHGILSEYVKFTKVGDKMREKHGYTRKTAEITVDYCISHGILEKT